MTRSQATPESSQIITLTRMLEEREETIAAQAAVIEKLKSALEWLDDLYLAGGAPNVFAAIKVREALAIPTDSTQILEQYVKEKTQAQAAVIEKLAKRLASTNILLEAVCVINPDSACAKYELAENRNATPTDSTQILAEVRRAERERVAQMILNGRFLHDESPAALFAKEVAAAIRAME